MRLLNVGLSSNDKNCNFTYQFFRLAELKKEQANQLYSAKQYKQALIIYNEVIGKYYLHSLTGSDNIFLCYLFK